jgi:hypothetical protein
MENKENENNYVIPANYTDSGKLFGGMVAPRNAAEAVVTLLTVGYLEYLTIPAGTVRIIAMAVTLLPLGILALMGIDGDSLLQYFWQVVRYVRRRRKLHFQKIGGEQNEKETG